MSGFVITAAKRTAIGAFQGALRDTSAVQLGEAAVQAVLPGIPVEDIKDIIVGNVLQAGNGMNVARQIALNAGLPQGVTGQTVNRVCGSGMQAMISAIQGLTCEDGQIYIVGGTESMSRAPYLLPGARRGYRYGHGEITDSILSDGLIDPTLGYAMGLTAENIAEELGISREEQDRFALESHMRAASSLRDGIFTEEIVPVSVKSDKGGMDFAVDEHVRPGTTIAGLAKLKAVFKTNGTVTAGNSSGLNDGAAMLSITTEQYAREHRLPVLARVLSYGLAGIAPEVMGLGPVAAIPIALKRAKLHIKDIDLFELNEAFAAQSIGVVRKLDLDMEKINIGGGAIALGHPIGASGARVVVTLVHALKRLGKRYGVASLCIGGGMGIAVVLSRD